MGYSLKVSLVLRVEDFETGFVLSPKEISLSADNGYRLPVYKPDGYFVFINERPQTVCISSEHYAPVAFTPDGDTPGVFRIALTPRAAALARIFPLPPGEVLFVGLGLANRRAGYALMADASGGAREITLQKNDMHDLTDMWHKLSNQADGLCEPVYLAGSMGHGKYRLRGPLRRGYAAREGRLLPMKRVVVPESGVLVIPIPAEPSHLFMMDSPSGEIREMM